VQQQHVCGLRAESSFAKASAAAKASADESADKGAKDEGGGMKAGRTTTTEMVAANNSGVSSNSARQAQHDKTGVWRADCDGAPHIVPKACGGRFPFQVKVKLLTSEIGEIPKTIVTSIAATSTNGRLDNLLDAGRAGELREWVEGFICALSGGDA
jgi:hypothetical protein